MGIIKLLEVSQPATNRFIHSSNLIIILLYYPLMDLWNQDVLLMNLYRFGAVYLLFHVVGSLLFGWPLIYLELVLGQYFSHSIAWILHRATPLFTGLGIVIFVLLIGSANFSLLPLIWYTKVYAGLNDLDRISTCNNTWNKENCYDHRDVLKNSSYEITSLLEKDHTTDVFGIFQYFDYAYQETDIAFTLVTALFLFIILVIMSQVRFRCLAVLYYAAFALHLTHKSILLIVYMYIESKRFRMKEFHAKGVLMHSNQPEGYIMTFIATALTGSGAGKGVYAELQGGASFHQNILVTSLAISVLSIWTMCWQSILWGLLNRQLLGLLASRHVAQHYYYIRSADAIAMVHVFDDADFNGNILLALDYAVVIVDTIAMCGVSLHVLRYQFADIIFPILNIIGPQKKHAVVSVFIALVPIVWIVLAIVPSTADFLRSLQWLSSPGFALTGLVVSVGWSFGIPNLFALLSRMEQILLPSLGMTVVFKYVLPVICFASMWSKGYMLKYIHPPPTRTAVYVAASLTFLASLALPVWAFLVCSQRSKKKQWEVGSPMKKPGGGDAFPGTYRRMSAPTNRMLQEMMNSPTLDKPTGVGTRAEAERPPSRRMRLSADQLKELENRMKQLSGASSRRQSRSQSAKVLKNSREKSLSQNKTASTQTTDEEDSTTKDDKVSPPFGSKESDKDTFRRRST